jgi:hypothetical protein
LFWEGAAHETTEIFRTDSDGFRAVRCYERDG